MKQTKLYELLKSFDEHEWSGFSTFLFSKSNEKSSIIKLYKYVYTRRKNLDNKKLEIDEIRIDCFKNIKRKNLLNLMSRLSMEIDKFLVLNEIKNDPLEQDLRLFMAYNKRGLYHRADLLADRLKKSWSDENHCDHQRMYKLLQLNHYHFLSNNPIKYTNKNILLELLMSFSNHKELLGMYYQAIYENAKFYKLVSSDIPEFDVLLDSFSDFNNKTFYRVCKSLLSIQLEENDQDFNVLYTLLTNNQSYFSNEIREVIYEKCEHFIIKKLAIGESSYVANLFSLYEYGIDNNIVTSNGKLPTLRFHNYIAAACAFEEVVWARMFRSKYIVLVEKDSIETSKLISKGQIYFAEKKYFECIKVLHQCDVIEINAKLRIRQLLLCSHFILHDNYDFIFSVVNNFINFIYYNKAKLTSKNYKGCLTLVRIIKMYISAEDMDSINKFIETSEFLVFRNRLPTIFAQRKLYEEKLAVAQNN